MAAAAVAAAEVDWKLLAGLLAVVADMTLVVVDIAVVDIAVVDIAAVEFAVEVVAAADMYLDLVGVVVALLVAVVVVVVAAALVVVAQLYLAAFVAVVSAL